MKDAHKISPYSLRIKGQIKEKAQVEAQRNRRSLNAEIGLLVEEGLQWRELKNNQAIA
ncbi:hypothetical protein QN366_04805 [Pseudomonas sp. CCC3.2]|uniref:hypothetical protein n=1 Tax=unclassified Pseudomonas TaxID=196821 RepID=UPI002AB57875|nr:MULTISPECIES: hypothetical protein [unclassified Pseudomonas]MDY7559967.1 hypothetical protein [Pseudomonas sp. AB6]MEA9994534.1 hypothetical protein [Pseudomonas sp. AA4]MEB0085678.1 hypothetical protein [Pseudomonas sp. RTI1]MEB0125996.1 hypothetical protein [Pseudomonas sp. CCC1.2]MEB0152801.1 hypothetical protein [Pseudomonas sp. CCC4.3]